MITIPIAQVGVLPDRKNRGNVLVFKFRCDISFDGNPDGNARGKRHEPRTYVFAGWFSSSITWAMVERSWIEINRRYRVTRFHAAHLNSKTYEYEGWTDSKKIEYSKELLAAIAKHGSRMYGITCGLFADEYRKIISEDGQRKMGSPYLVCFNSCVARVARMMDEPGWGNLRSTDKFEVLIDPDEGYLEAVKSFYELKGNPAFPHRSRLGTCTPITMDEVVAMQPADLIAYEAFKRLHKRRADAKSEIRHVLKSLMKANVVNECYMGKATLERMKEQIESAQTHNGQLIIIPQN